MKYHTEKDGTTIVFADGELTTYEASGLKDALLGAMEAGKRVELDFAAVGSIDLACLQLIYSAFNGSDESGLEMIFSGGIPEVIAKAFDDAGYPNAPVDEGQESKEVA